MSKPNMKPYDPEHKGEFCTRDGRPVRILATDRKSKSGKYPVVGLVAIGNEDDIFVSWSKKGEVVIGLTKDVDLMCVIPKREAHMMKFNSDGGLIGSYPPTIERANAVFREVMPDDISQEKARAVIEAARAFVNHPDGDASDALTALRDALGDDA